MFLRTHTVPLAALLGGKAVVQSAPPDCAIVIREIEFDGAIC
jgi:hypothetical protein